jgi:hypothetical protein
MAWRRVAEWVVWSVVLAGGTMLLQAQAQPQKKGGASHSAPAAHEHSATPPRQEHLPTPVREHASPTPEHPAAHSQGRTFGNHPPQTPRVPNSAGRQTIVTPLPALGGRTPGGQVREVHLSSGATVYHPPGGPRRVELARPGGQVVVARAPGHGYVQRPIMVRNTTLIKRTYMQNGVPVARFYRPRMFNSVPLFVYRPVRYYRPAFYRWAYNPWRLRVVYEWGWARAPWYGYYGGYFSPYPMYASPSEWLTDYLIAETLESAYQERMAANSTLTNNYAGGQAITPETKQAISEEVRRQIDALRLEQSEVSHGGSVTTIFSDNAQHVFVANSSYMYNSDAGECMVNEGDLLLMTGALPTNAASADVVVLSSRGTDCAKGSRVSVPLQDLQEMYNAMMATVDRGLGEMQAKQGRDGIPALPPGSTGTIDSPYAVEAQPDENVSDQLNGAIQETERAERETIDQAAPASTKMTFSTTGPVRPALAPGLSMDEAKAIQGEPLRIVEVGNRKVYVYKDLKITFTNGRLTDIEK